MLTDIAPRVVAVGVIEVIAVKALPGRNTRIVTLAVVAITLVAWGPFRYVGTLDSRFFAPSAQGSGASPCIFSATTMAPPRRTAHISEPSSPTRGVRSTPHGER